MNTRRKKLLINLIAGAATLAGAAFVLMPAAALAAPASATAPVNVRSGPGTGYGVVDTLQRGQRVDVGACRGSWCPITYSGGSGWVSANYLSTGGGSGGSSRPNPDVGFGISIGSGGVSVGIGVGTPGRPPVVRPVVGEVCFYERAGFRGASTCIDEGDAIRNLGGWAYRIGSIDNPDGLDVRVCTAPNFRGSCRTYTTSASSLGRFDGEIVSVRAD